MYIYALREYIFRQFISTIVQHLSSISLSLSLCRSRLFGSKEWDVNRDLEQEPSQPDPFPLYIYRTLEHNSLGEISSATIKEQVDRVIFHRQFPPLPWIGHVDSIMQKYDNSPTPSGPVR